MKRYFVTGIGTEVGKTVVSALLCKALGADYWKPIQAGELEHSDSDRVKELVGNAVRIHPESYRLDQPRSPHASARADGIRIDRGDLVPPETENPLVIEGAGGLMVPLNDDGDMIVDLIQDLQAEVVLVSRNFLGSINQTLLSVELLKGRRIPVKGIIFNGPVTPDSENIILDRSGYPMLGRVEDEPELSPSILEKYVPILRKGWEEV